MKKPDDTLSKLASIAQLLSVLQRPQELAQDEENTKLSMALKFLDLTQGRNQQEAQLGLERQRLAQEAAATAQAGDLRKQEFATEQQHWADQSATEKSHWEDEKTWREHVAQLQTTQRDEDTSNALATKLLESGDADAEDRAEAVAKGSFKEGLTALQQKHHKELLDMLDKNVQAIEHPQPAGQKLEGIAALKQVTKPEDWQELVKTRYGGVEPTAPPQLGGVLSQMFSSAPTDFQKSFQQKLQARGLNPDDYEPRMYTPPTPTDASWWQKILGMPSQSRAVNKKTNQPILDLDI